ncbi:hypothetical protein J2W48_002682 [Flavobacterium piscis]|uniref:Uncharacterized protein n=1 Tax=Flavobacterium piscis TaxID=1114874 RepID=A0ABU1Y925_9FLAO|nr:hypothetical protein [Flavobacterium piscis]
MQKAKNWYGLINIISKTSYFYSLSTMTCMLLITRNQAVISYK